mmetsp:Transcript_3692/g.5713  ORF Transcript_3692/g.5713 Transcript_3692/m.5713 type:complete len:1372 (+) Transcript_3692:182-4297(+)
MRPLSQHDEDEDEGGKVEMGLLHGSPRRSVSQMPVSGFSTTSVFAKTPVKSTEGYEQIMLQERSLFLAWFLLFVVTSPLVFRYAMGSNIVHEKDTTTLRRVDNVTLHTVTQWDECIDCQDVFGVTLFNLTVIANNVTSPNPDGNVPSLAVFASQDFDHWYSVYAPKKLKDAYIDTWQSTTFEIFNGTGFGCLGGVYHNYLVICMNVFNIAMEYSLGEKVEGPPFNDRCFQVDGICGVPCVSSEDAPDFRGCEAGVIDKDMMVSNETRTFDTGHVKSEWMSNVNWVEWVVLVTIFFDTFGNILRFMPVLSGRPTELESARSCLCEGISVLGCTSPFVSEDEAIFLRSLIGRSVTIFHTVGGRHNMQGMYLDTILNEKRGKGEANRRYLWYAWMEFLTLLARIGAEDPDDYDEDEEYEEEGFSEDGDEFNDDKNDSRGENAVVGDNGEQSKAINRQTSAASTHVSHPRKERRSTLGPRASRATLSQVPVNIRGRSSIADITSMTQTSNQPIAGSEFGSLRVNSAEVVNYDKRVRSSTIAGTNTGPSPSFRNHEIFARMSQATRASVSNPRASVGGGPKLPNIARRMQSIGEATADDPYAEFDDDFVGEPREIDPFDAEEDLEFDMADLLPLVCFLDGWLEAIKDKEWTYNYRKKAEALESIFNAAPLEVYFQGNDLLMAHNCLKNLYDAFVGMQEDEKDHGMPIHPELYEEINWLIVRRGLPDWTVTWSYMSRARLRPMSDKAMGNPPLPPCLFESTRIKPGAIVYRVPDADLPPHDAPENWLAARAATYKVVRFERSVEGSVVRVVPWPEMDRPNGDPFDDRDPSPICLSLQEIALIEQNRGKAGALNVYKDFLRCKAAQWVAEQGIPGPVQVFMAIIDARHMLAEPEIFWNDALPFFARNKESGESAKDYGEMSAGQQCIMVQYPQFFTNVTRDDFLDNKNSAYYTIWQTLRDCGKTITSSGTNAIWEITNPTFSYATTSRIEDTGTSQKYIPRYIAVHLPCFVAYGIAKQTEDYIEAVYRWSTGAVELFWSTIFSPQFSDYVLMLVLCVVFALSCFGSSGFWYVLWIIVLIATAIQASTDKANGRRPLRRPIVSSTIVMNTMYWISNLVSTVWMILIPIRIAFYSEVPLSQSIHRSLFWGFAALLLRAPPAIMTDRIVNMCRFLSLKTDDWNYSMVLWRSSQLYSCSFAYSTLSIITGTGNAFKAKFFDRDLTMWSSFRVSDAAFKTAWDKIARAESFCTCAFFNHLLDYFNLCLKSIIASFSMPDVLTKWWALFLFTLQITCIFVSVNITNVGDTTGIFITLVVCGFNTLLCIDITVLLFPSITLVIGRPARPEYVFAFLGCTVVLSALVNGDTSLQQWNEIVKLSVNF